MSVISLLNKIFCGFSLVLLMAMAWLGYQPIGSMAGMDKIIAGPVNVGEETLEKLSDNQGKGFLLSYESKHGAYGETALSMDGVTVYSVNEEYVFVWNLLLLDGGFLTKAQVENEERAAVLNEAAAFRLFGATAVTGQQLAIDGEPFTITGVVKDDGDKEDYRVYIPYTTSGRLPDTIAAVYNEGGHGHQGPLKNDVVERFSSLGIIAGGNYTDSRLYRLLPFRLFWAALFTGGLLLSSFLMSRICRNIKVQAGIIGAAAKKYYFPQLIHENRKPFLYCFFLVLLAVGLFVFIFICLAGLLDFTLVYNEILRELAKSRFTMDYPILQRYGTRSMGAVILAILYLASLISLIFINFLTKR